jgi:hypothetical protein
MGVTRRARAAKCRLGRRRLNLQRSVTARSLKLQSGLDPDSNQWSEEGSDFSDQWSDWSISENAEILSQSEILKEAESALLRDSRKLDRVLAEVNLLQTDFSKVNCRKAARNGQWPKRDAFPPGDYKVEPHRDTIRLAIYQQGLLKSLIDTVNVIHFSSYSCGEVLKNLFRKFLRNFPRRYFFSSPDLKSVRAQVFWALRATGS